MTVLDCEIGENSRRPHEELVALSVAEPDASVETLCLTLEDGDRLCRLLQSLEPEMPRPVRRTQNSAWKASFIIDAEKNVNQVGYYPYLRRLKDQEPDLGRYADRIIRSLTLSIRRHCSSRAARRSLEQRLVETILVLADIVRTRK